MVAPRQTAKPRIALHATMLGLFGSNGVTATAAVAPNAAATVSPTSHRMMRRSPPDHSASGDAAADVHSVASCSFARCGSRLRAARLAPQAGHGNFAAGWEAARRRAIATVAAEGVKWNREDAVATSWTPL